MSSKTAHLPYLNIMAARGWTWNEEIWQFVALGATDRQGCPILSLRVGGWDGSTWMANYGVPGIGYGCYVRRATPMEAADEAEAWLRGVLAPLTFPWLHIDKATP